MELTPQERAEFGIESHETAPLSNGTAPQARRFVPDKVKLLPQSPDAEKGVLSSFLISPRVVGALCVEKQVTKEHFFIPANAIIFEVLMALWDRNEPIDFIILTQLLTDQGRIDQVGGPSYPTELFTLLPTAANAEYYVQILVEKHQCRQVKAITREYDLRIDSEQDELPRVLDDLERDVMAIRKVRAGTTQHTSKQLVVKSIGLIESMYDSKGEVTGIATGFRALDVMLNGLQPKEMIVIAARPGRGKTALAMNMVDYIAVESKKPVGVFSLEMSAEQLMLRMLCSRARVNPKRVQKGYMTESDFPAITVAGSKIAEAKIFIDDESALTSSDIRGRARRWKAEHDIQALFIDYLQLIRSLSRRAQDNRTVEVSEASASLKALAKELGIPIVVLAQINRLIDHRGAGARPRLSDLRESGSIEQDADTVAFITQPWMDSDSDDERKQLIGEANLIVAKNRNGPVGDVALTFLREFTCFELRANTEESETPKPNERKYWDQ